MEDLGELRQQAEGVLEHLNANEDWLQRPIFVEFSGTPKSGKSTCIDIVNHFFRRLKFKVLAPTEGASKRTPYYLRDNLVAFNTWSASYALMHILEGVYGSDKYHLAILDRGLFDALAWFELLTTQGKVTPEERDQIHNFLRIAEWYSKTDAVFLFHADPETSLKREIRDKLVDDPGSTMNPEFLTELNGAYDQVRAKYASDFPRFTVIDTSDKEKTNPQATAKQVASSILEIFEPRAPEGKS